MTSGVAEVPLRKNLTTELRPRRFSEVTGYAQIRVQLENLFAQAKPRALMFIGEPGTGKTTLARIIARSVNCEHAPFGEPCDACLTRVFNIHERNCADLTKMDDTRPLLEKLDYHPLEGTTRVIILDEAQQMSDGAQQMLLKPFEEAAAFNMFIICTTDPQKIKQALKDRCAIFKLPGMTADDTTKLVLDTVVRSGLSTETPEAMALYLPLVQKLREREITSPRNIVMAVERFLTGMEIDEAAMVESACAVDMQKLFAGITRSNWTMVQEALRTADPKTRDFEEIRARLVGYFRNQLLSATTSKRARVFSQAILTMNERPWPMEHGQALALLVANIYRVCQLTEAAATEK